MINGVERRRRAEALGYGAEPIDQAFQRFRIEFGFISDVFGGDHFGERCVERLGVGAGDDFAIGLEEPPIAVESHARIAARADEAVDGRRVHADVKDGVEHAGHRFFRARTNRDE